MTDCQTGRSYPPLMGGSHAYYIFMEVTKMSNAERIALTRKQEFGYDEFNENHYEYKAVKVLVRGKVVVFHPKEVK